MHGRNPRRLVVVLTSLVALVSPAAAAEAPSHDAAPQSYWGPFPAESESVRTRYQTAGREAWEWPLYVPWKVASLPFDAVHYFFKYTYLGLARAGLTAEMARLFRPVDIPYGFSVNGVAGNLTGLGLGLNVYHDALFREGNRLQLKLADSTHGRQRFTLGFVHDGGRGAVEMGVGYRKTPNARFYGLGPYATEADESRYTQEVSWAGVAARRNVGPGFTAEAGAMYTTLRSRRPRSIDDDAPALADAYAAALPAGYGQHSDGWLFQASLEHDDTDGEGRPRTGGVRRAVAAYFKPSETPSTGFGQYRAELQQFLPLWYDRVLALRGYLTWIGLPTDRVHFQRLLTNDDPDLFRGYSDFRFRDRGMLGLTAEYRYPVWAFEKKEGTGLDAYLFFDWAQVYGSRDDIGLRVLTESYGLGFRLVSLRGFSARAEVGFSEEGTVFRLRTDQLFQYHKRGFYHGRLPVPPR